MMLKFTIKKNNAILTAIALLSLLLFVEISHISYDFLNYLQYVENLEKLEGRFSTEPVFSYLSLAIGFLVLDPEISLRYIYGICFSVLSVGVASVIFSFAGYLGIKSKIAIVAFISLIPFLILIGIVPRQSLSIGFSLLALSEFIRNSKARNGEVAVGRSHLRVFIYFLESRRFKSCD